MQNSGFAEAALSQMEPFSLGARTQSDALFALPSPGMGLGPGSGPGNLTRDNLRPARSADLGHRPSSSRHSNPGPLMPGGGASFGSGPQQPRGRATPLHGRTSSGQASLSCTCSTTRSVVPATCLEMRGVLLGARGTICAPAYDRCCVY